MNQKRLDELCDILDVLNRKEHIFFMTKKEYEKEFDWLISIPDGFLVGKDWKNETTQLSNQAVAYFMYNGFHFYVISPKNTRLKLKDIIRKLRLVGGIQDTRRNDEDFVLTPYLFTVVVNIEKAKVRGIGIGWGHYAAYIGVGYNIHESYPSFQKFLKK